MIAEQAGTELTAMSDYDFQRELTTSDQINTFFRELMKAGM